MAEKKNSGASWFLWWKIDPGELARGVAGYESKNPFKTPRGVAAGCFLFISVVTLVMGQIQTGAADKGLVDAGLALLLALFLYLGHRWAMLVGMAYWTISKLVAVIVLVTAGNGGMVITHVIWWCVFMHPLWLAFRVEQARRRPETLEVSVFD